MNARVIRYTVLAALGASLMGVGGAAEAQTLEETLVSAYQTNPSLAAQRARLSQTEEGYVQARAGRLPTVSASADVSEQETWGGAFNARNGDLGYGVSLNQPLYRGGRIDGSIDAALARVEAGRESLRSAEQGVLLSAVAAHAEVVRDRQIVAIRSNNVDVLAEQLRAARDRFEVGEITRTDVAQAEARLSGARAQLSAAQAGLAASRAAYARVTGVEPTDPEAVEPAAALPEALADAAEVALSTNPDLRAAQFQEIAAEQGVRIARGAMRPDVSVSASASEGRASDFTGQARGSATVRAQLSVPIFTGGLNQSRVREARAAADEARLSQLAVRRQVIEGVTNAWNNYLAAQAVIASSREAVRANEIAFEGVEQEAFVGLRTTLDVLNAEQELLNSRLELVRAERDLTVAAYALLQAMGILDAERLGLPVADARRTPVEERGLAPNLDLTPWN
ncbi:MAG: TolC family outer membrane protein [Alphaproteobacteria bacterium]|nr:TolC family outer membrane protein [Alphaproteobacteria bacterium]